MRMSTTSSESGLLKAAVGCLYRKAFEPCGDDCKAEGPCKIECCGRTALPISAFIPSRLSSSIPDIDAAAFFRNGAGEFQGPTMKSFPLHLQNLMSCVLGPVAAILTVQHHLPTLKPLDELNTWLRTLPGIVT